MSELTCQYLRCEKTAFRRVGRDLRAPADIVVMHTWYCRHPFHGIPLELGDARLAVEERCGACSLPHAGEESPRRDERGEGAA